MLEFSLSTQIFLSSKEEIPTEKEVSCSQLVSNLFMSFCGFIRFSVLSFVSATVAP